jgi:ABC-type nitrate/sulfonate/bicarbonate transport system ATPase subunit
MEENASQPKIKVDHLSLSYKMEAGKTINILDDINFSVREGSFVCILGPSGCGKSTLFNLIAGLIPPTSGNIYLDSEKINNRTGLVGYMFQKDLLLPWRSVLENITLGTEIKGRDKAESKARAMSYINKYGLAGFENYYPKFLSGGMRQRAAFLRTMMLDNQVMLLDEPFGALDAQTRLAMQEWLHEVWRDSKKTIIFITHDVDESLFLAEEVLVLSHRPSKIIRNIHVPLPEKRDYEMMGQMDILKLRTDLFSLLRHESSMNDQNNSSAPIPENQSVEG